jgi:hypothetical protein
MADGLFRGSAELACGEWYCLYRAAPSRVDVVFRVRVGVYHLISAIPVRAATAVIGLAKASHHVCEVRSFALSQNRVQLLPHVSSDVARYRISHGIGELPEENVLAMMRLTRAAVSDDISRQGV